MGCLQYLFLFTNLGVVYNICFYLRTYWRFVYNICFCLRIWRWFTIFALVFILRDCLQYLFLFTYKEVVYNLFVLFTL